MTKPDEKLLKKLNRVDRWASRSARIWDRVLEEIEHEYRLALRELDENKKQTDESFRQKEEELSGRLEQSGRDFAQEKYQLEKDKSNAKFDVQHAEEEYKKIQTDIEIELNRVKEEHVSLNLSHDRQKCALTDLYDQKRRNLREKKTKLTKDLANVQISLKKFRDNAEKELEKATSENQQKINFLKEQLASKQEGWNHALNTLKRGLETLNAEKDSIIKRLSNVRRDKEAELQAAQKAYEMGKEQLEVDKATLIERAESDQRQMETDIKKLQDEIHSSESKLQELILNKDQKLKDAEDRYVTEEQALKDVLKSESEKREYEQKLFEQERKQEEKQVSLLKEEYERKKWHWDNQIRALLMQKSVQDSEHEAERMRVDREARTTLRNLEAQRNEMKQKLGDLKSRHDALTEQNDKEIELLKQRWSWRKDRLWTMWQNRLAVIKNERKVLSDQLEHMKNKFKTEKGGVLDETHNKEKRIDDLQQFVLRMSEQKAGEKKQREIQLELEKARFIAQIKECEVLITEWRDRLAGAQANLDKKSSSYREQMSFMDHWYQDEQRESDLFLESLHRILGLIYDTSGGSKVKTDAA